jgi:hypothetical protein
VPNPNEPSTQSHVNQAALIQRDLELLALTTKGRIVCYLLFSPPRRPLARDRMGIKA